MSVIHVMPRTRFGRLSVILVVGFVIAMKILFLLGDTGQQGGATFFSNPLMAATLLTAGFCGIAAGVSSGVALLRARDWAVVLLLPLALGLFVAYFALGNFLADHWH